MLQGTGSTSERTPVALPASDTVLRCHVNLNTLAMRIPLELSWDGRPLLNRPLRRFLFDELITDLYANTRHEHFGQGDLKPRYEAMRDFLTHHVSKALLGSYISSQDVDTVADQYPIARLDRDLFAADELLPGRPYPKQRNRKTIDFRQPVAEEKLRRSIVNEAVGRGLRLLYCDNVRHPDTLFDDLRKQRPDCKDASFQSWANQHSGEEKKSDPTWTLDDSLELARWNCHYPEWHESTAYLGRLRWDLHRVGIRMITNVAWSLGGVSDQEDDVDELLAVTDGASFEMALHPYVRLDKGRLERNRRLYRRMLDAGMCVAFIPQGDTQTGEYQQEAELLAAWAMMIRQSGDRVWVASPYWLDNPDWLFWPLTLGDPNGPADFSAFPEVHRKFAGGELTVDLDTKDVTMTIRP